MNSAFHQKHFDTNSKAVTALLFFIFVFTAMVIMQDAVEARFQHSAFYLSESVLFSSFWWLFAPLLFAQYRYVKSRRDFSFLSVTLLITTPVVTHLVLFPVLVWLISALFYYHTFSVRQTLEYTLSEHLYHLLFVYSALSLLFWKYQTTYSAKPDETAQEVLQEQTIPVYITSIVVTEANRQIVIPVADIRYIAASSPYITLHTGTRKYLHNETLSSVTKQLDDRQFIRIHKSTIVNIHHVTSCASRLNGDYDITVTDGSTLRVSRNYAARFKEMFGKR